MASLKGSARTFIQAAFPELIPLLPKHADGSEGMLRWEPLEKAKSDSFILRPAKTSAMEECLTWEPHRVLPELPQMALFADALSADSRTGPLMGHLIGSPNGGSLLDAEKLASSLLWSVAREQGELLFNEDSFNRGYTLWLNKSVAKEEEVTILAPLEPLKLTGRIELEKGLEIDQLDDDEVSACLSMGAVSSLWAPSGIARVDNRAAVRIRVPMPRGIHDDFSEDERGKAQEAESDARNQADEVADCLRLFKKGRVSVFGRVSLHPGGSRQGGPLGVHRIPGPGQELDASEGKKLVAFWHSFKKARANRALDMAIRRFAYAGARLRPDDEIVDLVASLEGLLLAGIVDRRELGYRTKLRAAFFIEGSGLTRRETQRQIGRAYAVRSSVAHGGVASKKDLKSTDGSEVSLWDFVREIEELVRLALRKAVLMVGQDGQAWPPDWDVLILGQ